MNGGWEAEQLVSIILICILMASTFTAPVTAVNNNETEDNVSDLASGNQPDSVSNPASNKSRASQNKSDHKNETKDNSRKEKGQTDHKTHSGNRADELKQNNTSPTKGKLDKNGTEDGPSSFIEDEENDDEKEGVREGEQGENDSEFREKSDEETHDSDETDEDQRDDEDGESDEVEKDEGVGMDKGPGTGGENNESESNRRNSNHTGPEHAEDDGENDPDQRKYKELVLRAAANGMGAFATKIGEYQDQEIEGTKYLISPSGPVIVRVR